MSCAVARGLGGIWSGDTREEEGATAMKQNPREEEAALNSSPVFPARHRGAALISR